MPSYRTSLPNLNSFVAFEAAARHESFTLAAEELGLTPSAVSHRVRALEDGLGFPVFERQHRAIRLNGRGSELYSSVVMALNHLMAARDTLAGRTAAQRLRFCVGPFLANFLIEPRLPSLFNAVPEIALDLVVSDREEDFFRRATDAAIVLGEGSWPGYHATYLFEEAVFPVCAPSYLEQYGPIQDVDALAKSDLIDLSFEKAPWLNWTTWLEMKGAKRDGVQRVFESNSYQAVITAAMSGRGVAMGWRHLLSDHLRDGRLVIALDETVVTQSRHYFVCPEGEKESPNIVALRDWLLKEVGEMTEAF